MEKYRGILLKISVMVFSIWGTALPVYAQRAPSETLPLTGDNTPFPLIFGAMIIAAIIIIILLITSRKK